MTETTTTVVPDPRSPADLLAELRGRLEEAHDWDHLFDLTLLAKKFELGLPLFRPTSFDDVPAALRPAFEEAYMAAARVAGESFLKDGKIAGAFPYFQAIRDLEPVREALLALPVTGPGDGSDDEVIQLALHQRLAPLHGLQMLIKTQGICSTISALDEVFPELGGPDRSACAAVMVRHLHKDLLLNVQRDVRKRLPVAPAAPTLESLIAGRDWLFEDANYHVDVSHLHSVVRFARSLSQGAPEIALAKDLAEYGQHLAEQFQYEGQAPFQSYYPAHIQFFNVLLGTGREAGLKYFRDQITSAEYQADRVLAAYVLVDLLARIRQLDEAIAVARQELLSADEQFVVPFAELCRDAGAWDLLAQAATQLNHPILEASALLSRMKAGQPATGATESTAHVS